MSGDQVVKQWVIRSGVQEATIVEVGGGLRTYTVDGVDVVAGYGAGERADACRGQHLVPWPNRIRDGRYSFDGVAHQLALSEPELHNANHGLAQWTAWQGVPHGDDSVSVSTTLFPQPGWDGLLGVTVSYVLDDSGLTVTSSAINRGRSAVPFGYGAHPYVAIGDTPLAEVMLRLPAGREVLVDDRLLPIGTQAVRPEFDFRERRALGQTSLDTGFTDLARDEGTGRWTVVVSGVRDRAEVAVWGDQAFDWLQVFTARGADTGVAGTRGIAVEPMSCAADAFNSGDGLVVLGPGQSWVGTWGIGPRSV